MQKYELAYSANNIYREGYNDGLADALPDMLEHINSINALTEQVESILDLMQCSEDGVDITSVRTCSEMCLNMVNEICGEVEKIYQEWKGRKDD